VTVAFTSVAPVLVIVKVKGVVPALPSAFVTSSIVRTGALSSFVIVPVPSASLMVAADGLLR